MGQKDGSRWMTGVMSCYKSCRSNGCWMSWMNCGSLTKTNYVKMMTRWIHLIERMKRMKTSGWKSSMSSKNAKLRHSLTGHRKSQESQRGLSPLRLLKPI